MRAFALALTIAVSLCLAPAASAHRHHRHRHRVVMSGAAADAATQVGGAAYGQPNPATTRTTTEDTAVLLPDGLAAAPESAPQEVKDAIAAANEIIGKPYIYGGGHNPEFAGRGYDCSGTVSYALHGGGLLDQPLDSSSFMHWGDRGPGAWITVYTNPGHAFAVIAGLRLDTSAADDPSGLPGPRWRPLMRRTRGFRARHPDGF